MTQPSFVIDTNVVGSGVLTQDPSAPTAGAPRSERRPNVGDDHLWRLLANTAGAALVTGDDLLVRRPPPFARVLTPRAFAELLSDAVES